MGIEISKLTTLFKPMLVLFILHLDLVEEGSGNEKVGSLVLSPIFSIASKEIASVGGSQTCSPVPSGTFCGKAVRVVFSANSVYVDDLREKRQSLNRGSELFVSCKEFICYFCCHSFQHRYC